jgi:hypothetical protein
VLKAAFKEAWSLYRTHARHLLPAALLASLLITTFQLIWAQVVGVSVWVLIFLGPGASYTLYFILFAIHVQEGVELDAGHEHEKLGELLRRTRPQAPALIRAGLGMWIALDLIYLLLILEAWTASGPVEGIGLLLLAIVLVFIVASRSVFLAPAIAVEHLQVLPALKRSFELTRRRVLRLFGILLVTGLVTTVASWLVKLGFPLLYGSTPDLQTLFEFGPTDAGSYFGEVLAETLTAPFAILVAAYLYRHCRDQPATLKTQPSQVPSL